ncbi:MAG TPA: hypothetical protein VFJ58_02065 [Armatimonadota bacterium]|nr:hypothetical protein [Armatimonadota bacterium]
MKSLRAILAVALCMIAPLTLGVPAAQAAHHPTAHKVVHTLQKHRTLASIGAGVAAYKAAKITGHNRKMHGKKLNLAQRHPIISGMVAAGVTHHVLKTHKVKHRR